MSILSYEVFLLDVHELKFHQQPINLVRIHYRD